MLPVHIPFEHVEAIVDQRVPRPARLTELAARRAAIRRRLRR